MPFAVYYGYGDDGDTVIEGGMSRRERENEMIEDGSSANELAAILLIIGFIIIFFHKKQQ